MQLLQVPLFALHTIPKSDRCGLWLASCNEKSKATSNFKVIEFQNCAYFAKKRFKPIFVYESKSVDKIKSDNLMFLSMFILSKWRLLFFVVIGLFNLWKQILLIIKNFKCHHIALNTLHRRHKYGNITEQTASVRSI